MTTDKRSVFTDALETLGTIIDENQKRDAIHLAVEPVVAKEMLEPGDHVTVDGRLTRCPFLRPDAVGIVDPFLLDKVKPGERFWLVLYPRQITSLRHVWEHPAFPPSEVQVNENPQVLESEIENSKKWIQDFADSIELHYDVLMNGAHDWLYSLSNETEWYNGQFLNLGSLLEGVSVPDEFWHHYEIVTGKKVEEDKKRNFFTCTC